MNPDLRQALGVALMVANDDADALTDYLITIANSPERATEVMTGLMTASGALIRVLANLTGLSHDEVVTTFLDNT